METTRRFGRTMESDIKKIADRNTRVAKAFSPNAQAVAHANPKANLVTKMAMSRPVGKVFDSGVGKKMVGFGNAVKRGIAAPFKWAGGQIEKELKMDKAKDNKYKAAGAALNASYSGRRSTSDGSMR